MITSKENLLKRIALEPQMKGNKISIVFANNPNLEISKKDKFFDNVEIYLKNINETDRNSIQVNDNEDFLNDWKGKDLRIQKLKIKSVRGFPNSNLPFGIDFENNLKEPQSMVILGGNGSGKSSLFDALEFCYCEKVGEASLRTFEELQIRDYKDYLEHFSSNFTNSFCEVETKDKLFSLQNENIPKTIRDKINPDTHFISDYDIYSKCQLNYKNNGNNSFHNLIAKSLGLEELLNFETHLNSFIYYSRRTETQKVNLINKNSQQHQLLIENSEKDLAKKIEELEQLKKLNNDDLIAENPEYNTEILKNLPKNDISLNSDFDLMRSEISNFKEAFKKFTSQINKSGNSNQIQFLEIGKELLKDYTDCPFCVSSKKSKDQILLDINERLEQLNEANIILKNLNNSVRNLQESLMVFYNNVASIRGIILNESRKIKDQSEFNELFSFDNNFSAYLGSIMAEQFFNDWKEFNEKEDVFNFNLLYNIIENNSGFLEDKLIEIFNETKELIISRKVVIEVLENKFNSKSLINTKQEKIIILQKEVQDLNNQIQEAKNNVGKNNKEIQVLNFQIDSFNHVKDEVREYYKAVHSVLSKEVDKAFDSIKSIVEKIVQKYLNSIDRNIKLNIKKSEEIDSETGEVLSEIICCEIIPNDETYIPISVNKYFNTFHYRLFASMVCISIAVASRRNTEINLPIVMDDIFYASDFENRAKVENFIKQIFEIFQEYTPKLPLQLIIFTHDQLIFESAIKVSTISKVNNIEFVKLFPHSESIDEGSDFKNLVYKIPTYLPASLFNKTYSE